MVVCKLDSVVASVGVRGIADKSDAFIDLNDTRVEHLWLLDCEVKYGGSGLVADLNEVLEALGDDERVLLALSLEECVGGYGCGEADVFDIGSVNDVSSRYGSACGQFKNTTDSLTGSILVVGWVVGEELDDNVTRGLAWLWSGDAPETVGKCATTVDGDLDSW